MSESQATYVSEAERQLANTLQTIHGACRIASETSGIHAYFPCPECLVTYGVIELQRQHMTVNLTKICGLGKHAALRGSVKATQAGICHKCSKRYSLTRLMQYPPLTDRGISALTAPPVTDAEIKLCVIQDENGNWIPDHPGEVTPLSELPSNHPAIAYLGSRGIPPKRMCNQFRAAFCFKEAPVSELKHRFYKRLPAGFRDTPQNRIIFYADMKGVQVNWQARILDCVVGDSKFYLHPYENTWTHVEQKNAGKWRPVVDVTKYDWKPQKYKSAFSSHRRSTLLGFDHAKRWNAIFAPVFGTTMTFISEGPLDIGRFNGPGNAVIGRYLSDIQSGLLCSNFEFLMFLTQNTEDDANRKLEMSVLKELSAHRRVIILRPPEGVKDFGEMSDASACAHLADFASTNQSLKINERKLLMHISRNQLI